MSRVFNTALGTCPVSVSSEVNARYWVNEGRAELRQQESPDLLLLPRHAHSSPPSPCLHCWVIIQLGAFVHFVLNLCTSPPVPLWPSFYWCWQQSPFILCPMLGPVFSASLADGRQKGYAGPHLCPAGTRHGIHRTQGFPGRAAWHTQPLCRSVSIH